METNQRERLGGFRDAMEAHPYRYALVAVVPPVAVLSLALAALSSDLSTFPVWFGYKMLLWGSITLALTWWRQGQQRETKGPESA